MDVNMDRYSERPLFAANIKFFEIIWLVNRASFFQEQDSGLEIATNVEVYEKHPCSIEQKYFV